MSSNDIVRKSKDEMSASIESFNLPLANFLQYLGLPTENIFNPLSSRRDVIENLDSALRDIQTRDRESAYYLSKFTVAVSVGLFDGALNYLWNETINGLRNKVSDFDINYFYNIAGQFNSRYKAYQTTDELRSVDDADLLEACRRIGIISDVNFNRLIHINYMRNHASAAHPNSQELSGFELLSWLTTCLTHVIGAKFEHSVIYIQRFLDNFRKHELPQDDVDVISGEFRKLTQVQADDIAWAVFGMYCDPRSSEEVRKNTELLAEVIWEVASENRKYEIGAKFGYYRRTGEVQRRDRARSFLDRVGANRYKDDDSLAGELIEKLENLKKIHFSMNNFYNEHASAKNLRESLPKTGIIPRAARPLWVKVNVLGYVGNGMGYREGVDEMAAPYYKANIESFTDDELFEVVKLFSDSEFNTSLARPTAERRARAMLAGMRDHSKNSHIVKALQALASTPNGSLSSAHLSSNYRKNVEELQKYFSDKSIQS